VVRAPASNVVALAARTLEQTTFPPECMDVRLALFSVATMRDRAMQMLYLLALDPINSLTGKPLV
jgi:hypothetical protein